MPNWCTNKLTVTGPQAALDAFTKAAEGVDDDGDPLALSLAALAGREPDDADWLSWRRQQWGTKWDVEAERSLTLGEACYEFLSAWTPPSAAIATASKEHPELTFQLDYCEGGNCFHGTLTASAGLYEDQTVEWEHDCPLYGSHPWEAAE